MCIDGRKWFLCLKKYCLLVYCIKASEFWYIHCIVGMSVYTERKEIRTRWTYKSYVRKYFSDHTSATLVYQCCIRTIRMLMFQKLKYFWMLSFYLFLEILFFSLIPVYFQSTCKLENIYWSPSEALTDVVIEPHYILKCCLHRWS